jgi:hypothetical protein
MTWQIVLTVMLNLLAGQESPRQNDIHRLHELVAVAVVIAEEAPTAPEAADLIAIGKFESGFVIHAVGPLGEIGVWQLLGATRHERTAIREMTLRAQAHEALHRLHQQGWAGFTGEAGRRSHPLADHRRALAERVLAALRQP